MAAAATAEVYIDPYRNFLDGEGEKDTVWRDGAPPNYQLVNKLFEEGRTHVWPVGSLEEKVQRLVKSWEMEMVYKVRAQDLKSVNLEKFRFSVNARKEMTRQEIGEIGGSYNAFLQTSLPPELRIYDPDKETSESSDTAFKVTFPKGFAFEILEVYSGPPKIVYKFRHWSYMDGPFQGHAPTGELVNFFGTAIFHVDENEKITKVEFFYERGDFLSSFLKGAPLDGATAACPVLHSAN